MNKLKQLNHKHYLSIFVVLFILLALPLTVIQTLNSRDDRSQAHHTPATSPNDYNYAFNSAQWAPKKINADKVWDITTGSSSTIVATIGTGVDATHPDLDAKLIPGRNILDGTTNTDDDWAWGGNDSFVAGIIGAETNNTIGVAGIDWQTKILPVKVCSWQFCDSNHMAQGIRWAADNGADIINVSMFFPATDPNLANLESSVLYAKSKGITIVAGTGNMATAIMYPAAFSDTISVGLTKSDDSVESYSANNPDLVAPGVGIMTTAANGSYSPFTSSTFAAAHVSGVLALLLAKNVPVATATQAILEGAKDLGTAGYDNRYGNGRLDACGAFQRASVLLSRSDLACPVSGGGDTTAPTVSLTSPASGATLSGNVPLTATASDASGITKVEFYRGGTTKIGEDTTSPYSLVWNTTTVSNASYSLTARAYDGATPTNTATSTPVSVTVSNNLDPDNDGLTNAQEAALGTDPNNPDTDGDHCKDGREVSTNASAGGQRNPLDPWDFFDVNADGSIDLTDTLAILDKFGLLPGNPGYDAKYDREVVNASDPNRPWLTRQASSGTAGIDLADALANLSQFGHSCV